MASVSKILVGSPTYKTVVGNVTRIKKVVVGVPLSTVTIGPYADIDNIVGVDTTGKVDGGALVYDSASGNFVANRNPILEVDGKTYPSDSAHTNILIRRSGTQGEPVVLQQGEMAYSYLPDPATDGFGNGGDRLYIATGENDGNGNSTSIDVIGGKYFTDLLNHQQGTLTPNSAILVDDQSSVDILNAGIGNINSLISDDATITTTITPLIQTTDFTLRALNQDTFLTASLTTGSTIVNWRDYEVFRSDSVTVVKYGVGRIPGVDEPTVEAGYGAVLENNLEVKGYSFLDSTTVRGSLLVEKNLVVLGESTYVRTNDLLIKDRQIVVADGSVDKYQATRSGIAVGDSNTPFAYIQYRVTSDDSACWHFDPGICAPDITVNELKFEVIDCGSYA